MCERKQAMTSLISQDKVFKIMERFFFIGLMITSGWFASGVLQHFFSRKTSFTQHKEKVTDYPVVNIMFGRLPSEVNPADVEIKYQSSGMAGVFSDYQPLEIGGNYLHNNKYNKTEKVILESLENKWREIGFRIIHETPILEKNLALITIQKHNQL